MNAIKPNNYCNKTICDILLIVFLFIAFTISKTYASQAGKLRGMIKDEQSGEVLIGTNILITSEWQNNKEIPLQIIQGGVSDSNGEYFIINIRPGKYTVKADYIGYQEVVYSKVEINIDKTTELNFLLSPKSLVADEIIVNAYSPSKVERDLTATKTTYTVSDMENIAGVEDISDILELQADVVDGHFRGGRLGETSYILGGSAIVNPISNQRAFNPIVTGIEQVEVYTSGFSAEYGNAQSGVVNMVTKEGQNIWETRFEVAVTPPYYKTWGGSIYDEEKLYFYNTLINTEEWLKENPTQPGRALFDPGYGFGPQYLTEEITWPPNPLTRGDSLLIARLGQIQWLQSVRDVGLDYDNTNDYRFDFTVGGPLSPKSTIFIAARNSVVQPFIPTTNPDRALQITSNLVYRPNSNDKFKLNYIYDINRENEIGSSWVRWMFDRTLSISQMRHRTQQIGLEWAKVISASTVFETQLKILDLKSQERIELIQDDEYIVDYSSNSNWVDYTGPSYHRAGRPEDDRGNEFSKTVNISGNLISQLDKYNFLKAGFQFYYYDLKVDKDENAYNLGNIRHLNYRKFPYEGAFFIEDKMEFEGMIANLGLRLDFYNLNTNFFSDLYSPTRNPNYDPSLPYSERGQYYDEDLALKEDSKPYFRLQPRIGISFPITENSVFHLNYGTFTQRPNFTQLVGLRYYDNFILYGNPRLEPENTSSYDVGLVQGLPGNLRLDVSAYYKDVKNLVDRAFYWDEQQSVYVTYINRDYADIKGFHLSLERYSGNLLGYIRYNYEAATGKSSNDLDVPISFFEVPDPEFGFVDLPDAEDVYLDYDRTHKLVLNLRYKTNANSGFSFSGFYPFGSLSLSATLRYSSGRPYTWDSTGRGLKYNQRSPRERELRLRIEKIIQLNNSAVTIYVEGFNLFNEAIYDYYRNFNHDRNTQRYEYFKEQYENDLQTWLESGIDQDQIPWPYTPYEYETYDEYAPYVSEQSVYLYRNQPRHFRIGLKFNL